MVVKLTEPLNGFSYEGIEFGKESEIFLLSIP